MSISLPIPMRYQSTFWPWVISNPWRFPYSFPLIPAADTFTHRIRDMVHKRNRKCESKHTSAHSSKASWGIKVWFCIQYSTLLNLTSFLLSDKEKWNAPASCWVNFRWCTLMFVGWIWGFACYYALYVIYFISYNLHLKLFVLFNSPQNFIGTSTLCPNFTQICLFYDTTRG